MNEERAIDLYLELTNSIHDYWLGFGAIVLVLIGWLISRKSNLLLSQRMALTIGWFCSAGYLCSSLMNRYKLVAALTNDLKNIQGKSKFALEIENLGPIYSHYELIVWTSFSFISLSVLLLIWTNIVTRYSFKQNELGNKA